MGGVAAYLLIGVTWAFGYKLLLEMIPGATHPMFEQAPQKFCEIVLEFLDAP